MYARTESFTGPLQFAVEMVDSVPPGLGGW